MEFLYSLHRNASGLPEVGPIIVSCDRTSRTLNGIEVIPIETFRECSRMGMFTTDIRN